MGLERHLAGDRAINVGIAGMGLMRYVSSTASWR